MKLSSEEGEKLHFFSIYNIWIQFVQTTYTFTVTCYQTGFLKQRDRKSVHNAHTVKIKKEKKNTET